MEYLPQALRLVSELLELSKSAPGWWHASQVLGAKEMLEASVCIFELEQKSAVAHPAAEHTPPPSPEPQVPRPSPPASTEEPSVVYDEPVPTEWGE